MRDLLIIGSGPAGLSAALYAKRANLDVLVAEKEYMGGQIAESTQVDNYIGLVGINGFDLGEKFRQDAEKSGAEFYEGKAVAVTQKNGFWSTEFENGDIIESKAVIYALGAEHRKLSVKGEEKFIGKGISFCAVCDGALYAGKTVAVVGGGDTALDDALYLSDISKKVYIIHRRDKFRGSESTVSKIMTRDNIERVMPDRVTEIKGNSCVKSVMLESGRELETDCVFEAVGMIPASDLIKDIVDVDKNGYVLADETGVTKAAGLFAAGDVRAKKLRQVSTAVSDGANAAMSAVEYIKSI